MPRVPSGVTSLKIAFNAHLNAAQISCPSHHMLKFYATECGLKCVLTKRYILRQPSEVKELLGTHKLLDLVKHLRLPKTTSAREMSFRSSSGNSTFPLERLHEAWRYGVLIEATDEKAGVEWLDSVCEWIKGEI